MITVIAIGQEPKFEVEKKWSSSDIREMCIDNDWYTRGDVRAYGAMLEMVEHSDPKVKNIYKIAKDIFDHSDTDDGLTVETIMFQIANDVVKRFYAVID